ncbi:methyltransferase domain-containing protein [Chloroflexi bacterium TSY]|nr:methyltransferase domain-containing protein [Chloroflexi bacterium TSY]
MPHQFARLLEHPLRRRYRQPTALLGEFGIHAGMSVLDLGCGSGLFTIEMARMVGERGSVHAVDIQRPFLELTQARLVADGLEHRVTLHHSGAYQLPLPDDSIDLAVLVATLGEIPDKPHALAELHRVLKPDGRIVVSEELLDPAYVSSRLAGGWLEEAGFDYGGRTDSFLYYTLLYVCRK